MLTSAVRDVARMLLPSVNIPTMAARDCKLNRFILYPNHKVDKEPSMVDNATP